ncbi:hypothetical protein A2U01_0044318 [Trifolium medium]|uniref:Uncharacterized protein n=1 Tax=Trifolium medium TaxID=97028 RepID=A0A392QHC6_9FABA|nr:hypothetical protein [Trifolium medium]
MARLDWMSIERVIVVFASKLVLVANMKVVALFVSFPTSICASHWDTRSPSYALCNENCPAETPTMVHYA